ncbi:PTS sugar transporter subunit IIA [Geobacter sp.]|uniref:PTS sugar transporter subunit IIA n=1 Tax=Geobacter sp. TaxID=46610 RepID=UPI002613773B|nr:PTS sugar transporter subunit IIA [Geobacter sp.]
MLLNTAEAARLLSTDEKTVVRWVRKERLPATPVDGELRINRIDLLEWATDRGIKVLPEAYAGMEDEPGLFPSLSSALETGGIHCGVPGDDKLTALRNVVALLPLPPQMDPDFVLQVLLAREALGTTAIGDGIAIPHMRNPILLQVPASSITLCHLASPVDFGALDGKPVQFLFTLVSPTVKAHLHLLSRLAHALRDPRLREALKRPCDPAGIRAAVAEIERSLGG